MYKGEITYRSLLFVHGQVMKPVASAAQRWRLGLEDTLTAMDTATKRLLRFDVYDHLSSHKLRRATLEAQLWGESDLVSLRTDLSDCHIAVCSQEVLVAFSDNFDYQVGAQHGLPGC